MKRTLHLIILAAAMMVVAATSGGCDFIRSSVGKPTSAEIDAMRERKAAREKAYADSISRAETESLSLAEEKATAGAPEQERYYVVVGAFKDSTNAAKLAARIEKEQYAVIIRLLPSGLHAVAIPGAGHLSDPALAGYSPWLLDTSAE